MRKPAYAVLIVLLMTVGLLYVEVGHASSLVSGTIYANTNWTTGNSPYMLTGNLVIASGVSLTIQPGVTVNLGSYQIQVNGTLDAQGSSSGEIVFSGVNSPSVGIIFLSAGSDSTISNANIDSVFISIQQGSITLSSDYFSGISAAPIITVNAGYLSISNSVLNIVSTDGIDVFGGSALISGNMIVGQGHNYGIFTGGSASTTITQNNITACFTGIWAVGYSEIAQDNIVNNVNDGVCSVSSTIEFNALAGNTCGVSGGGTVEYNTITNNFVGIWSPAPDGTIAYNNIYANYNSTGGYTQNIHLTDFHNITATMNWWGLTGQTQIDLTIWDYKNDTVHLGTVIFEPALNSRETEAPSVPASLSIPTTPPTSIPSATATPSSSNSVSHVPSPTPYSSATPWPLQSYLPGTITPGPIIGSANNSGLYWIIAIAAAFIVAAAIIVVINVKFGRAKTPPPTKRLRHRRRSTKSNAQNPPSQAPQG
jgi:hypothetical protein